MRNNLDPFKVGILEFILYYYLNRNTTVMSMVRCYGNAWNKRNHVKFWMVFEKKKDLSAIFIVPLNQVPRTYFLGYNNLNVSLFSLARHGHRLTWKSIASEACLPFNSWCLSYHLESLEMYTAKSRSEFMLSWFSSLNYRDDQYTWKWGLLSQVFLSITDNENKF